MGSLVNIPNQVHRAESAFEAHVGPHSPRLSLSSQYFATLRRSSLPILVQILGGSESLYGHTHRHIGRSGANKQGREKKVVSATLRLPVMVSWSYVCSQVPVRACPFVSPPESPACTHSVQHTASARALSKLHFVPWFCLPSYPFEDQTIT